MNEIIKSEMFDEILQMMYYAKRKAEYRVNAEFIDLYWNIGEYVSKRVVKYKDNAKLSTGLSVLMADVIAVTTICFLVKEEYHA